SAVGIRRAGLCGGAAVVRAADRRRGRARRRGAPSDRAGRRPAVWRGGSCCLEWIFPGCGARRAHRRALRAQAAGLARPVPAPDAQADVDRWRTALRPIVEKHGAGLTILEVALDRQPARLAMFELQVAATEVRASHDAIRVAIGGAAMNDRARREDIYRAEL